MKISMNTLKSKVGNTLLYSCVLIYSSISSALDKYDLTSDASGGKDFEAIVEKQDSNLGYGGALLILFFGLCGLGLVGFGIFSLNKAGKTDGRESSKAGFISIILGGALTAVAVITGIIKNSIV